MRKSGSTAMVALKRSADVKPEVNLRNPIHTGKKACKQGSRLASAKIQKQEHQWPYKKYWCPQKQFFKLTQPQLCTWQCVLFHLFYFSPVTNFMDSMNDLIVLLAQLLIFSQTCFYQLMITDSLIQLIPINPLTWLEYVWRELSCHLLRSPM